MDFRSVSLPSRGAFHLSLSVLCAIGYIRYLVLDHGRPCFKRDFSCPALLRISSQRKWHFGYKAFTFSGSLFQHDSSMPFLCNSVEAQQRFLDGPATPISATAAALQVPHLSVSRNCFRGVAPFRDPRVNACLRLAAAFRRLLRLSSPVCTKASVHCP